MPLRAIDSRGTGFLPHVTAAAEYARLTGGAKSALVMSYRIYGRLSKGLTHGLIV